MEKVIANVPVSDRLLIETTMEVCNTFNVDPHMLEYMLQLEENLLSKDELEKYKGITLARACRESRFNLTAVGDHGKAIGIFQWWRWAQKYIDRANISQSVYFLFKRINDIKPKVAYQCRNLLRWYGKKYSISRMKQELFRIAYVTAIRSPSDKPRCKEAPKEFGLYYQIIKVIKNEKRKQCYTNKQN